MSQEELSRADRIPDTPGELWCTTGGRDEGKREGKGKREREGGRRGESGWDRLVRADTITIQCDQIKMKVC